MNTEREMKTIQTFGELVFFLLEKAEFRVVVCPNPANPKDVVVWEFQDDTFTKGGVCAFVAEGLDTEWLLEASKERLALIADYKRRAAREKRQAKAAARALDKGGSKK